MNDESAVAQHLPYDGAVLLLDPSLVVLEVWARAGELDSDAQAMLDQLVVHKFAAIVVDIPCAQREGQADSDPLKRLNDKSTVAHHKRSDSVHAGNIGAD